MMCCALLCRAADPLAASHLEAMHRQRVEWMKIRADAPLPGIYQDYRAVFTDKFSNAAIRDAKQAGAQIVIAHSAAGETLMAGVLVIAGSSNAAGAAPAIASKRLRALVKRYPDEVLAISGAASFPAREDLRFRHSSEHVLARELTAESVHASLHAQRTYEAEDWLCDPAGFFFEAVSAVGTYDIGDTAPFTRGLELRVSVPIAAHIQLRRGDRTVAESNGRELRYAVTGQGDYRVLVSVDLAGEQQRWIETNALHVGEPVDLRWPAGSAAAPVQVRRDIAYLDDGIEKHKLDLFLPGGKSKFPVMVFLHGGGWTQGDRSEYSALGIQFAKQGVGVVIPSYRLMPQNPHPAQILDAAAAFAWVRRNIARYGGDASRLYVAGHSAGAQLASLLALDHAYLQKFGSDTDAIRGVISLSGIYSVGTLPEFRNADDDPSPLDHVKDQAGAGAPRFLVVYCQWDAFGLPKQARDFVHALEKNFVPARLMYLPGENHVSEIVSMMNGKNTKAVIDFIQSR